MARHGEKRKDEIAHLVAVSFFARDGGTYINFEDRCEAINELNKEAKNKLAAYVFCEDCVFRDARNYAVYEKTFIEYLKEYNDDQSFMEWKTEVLEMWDGLLLDGERYGLVLSYTLLAERQVERFKNKVYEQGWIYNDNVANEDIENGIPSFNIQGVNRQPICLVDIDFTKPLDEIIAFVTAIKNDFDKDPSIIPMTRERLTGEPDTSLYRYDKKNKKKLWEKYADVLFIYDCKKVGLPESYIRNELDTYYQSKGINIKMSDKTYKELVKMGKEYIDKGKYKKFLHG